MIYNYTHSYFKHPFSSYNRGLKTCIYTSPVWFTQGLCIATCVCLCICVYVPVGSESRLVCLKKDGPAGYFGHLHPHAYLHCANISVGLIGLAQHIIIMQE